MAFDWVELVRLVHVVGAVVWFGGAVFFTMMVLPAVGAAGPAGKGFMATVLRRGGLGKFFAPTGGVTILAGLVLYWQRGYFSGPFDGLPTTFLTLGAIAAIAAQVEGAVTAMPLEKKMKAIAAQFGPTGPTPEQAATLEALGAKMRTAGMVSTVLLGVALLLMAGRNVF